ncbi:MAG TPA: helix-turn-helix transcriptional regulator [Pyrinomonadaceae bacterium]
MAAKLLQIRTKLDLTQDGMLARLNYHKSPLYASQISDFEQGKREPPLLVLLQYSRVAGVPVEVLIDDELNLPNKLPSEPSEWIMTRRAVKARTSRHNR